MGISADLSGFIVQQQRFMAGPDGMNIARIFPFVTFNFGQRFRCSMVAQQHPLRIVTPASGVASGLLTESPRHTGSTLSPSTSLCCERGLGRCE